MTISQESQYYKIDIETKSRIRHHRPEHRVFEKIDRAHMWRRFSPKTSSKTNRKGYKQVR